MMLRLWAFTLLAAELLLSSPVQVHASADVSIRFQIPDDALAYPNELSWVYTWDPVAGKMIEHPRIPVPTYRLRCFVMVRTTRQFLQHARFEPSEPKATDASYRHLVRLVLRRNIRTTTRPEQRVVIPGYRNLAEFSHEHAPLLKTECGGAWQSFLQRGNWRMVFPFSRRHQERTAERLAKSLDQGSLPIAHLVCFPAQTINHALLLYSVERNGRDLRFTAYDPNHPDTPAQMEYRSAQRRFIFPPSDYFAGGPVDVYEVYRGWFF